MEYDITLRVKIDIPEFDLQAWVTDLCAITDGGRVKHILPPRIKHLNDPVGNWPVRPIGQKGLAKSDCILCNGQGYQVTQRQGDPVPGHRGTSFASTLYVACECRNS